MVMSPVPFLSPSPSNVAMGMSGSFAPAFFGPLPRFAGETRLHLSRLLDNIPPSFRHRKVARGRCARAIRCAALAASNLEAVGGRNEVFGSENSQKLPRRVEWLCVTIMVESGLYSCNGNSLGRRSFAGGGGAPGELACCWIISGVAATVAYRMSGTNAS